MYVATVVLIVACALQVGIHWLRTRSVNKMHLVSGWIARSSFGGLTLIIHDTAFIRVEFSVVNWLFAAAFSAAACGAASATAR